MKRIKLIAQNYGETFGVDRAIRGLLENKQISGASVLVASDLWTREAVPLADLLTQSKSRLEVGMMICLTKPFAPISEPARQSFKNGFPSVSGLLLRPWMGRRFRRMIAGEIAAQLDHFEKSFGRPPDFIDGWQNIQDTALVRRALIHLKTRMERDLPGWIRASRPGKLAERWRIGRLNRAGIDVSPHSIKMPEGLNDQQMLDFFFTGLDQLPNDTVVTVRPAEIDERLRRLDKRYKERRRILEFLSSKDLELVLHRKDIYLF